MNQTKKYDGVLPVLKPRGIGSKDVSRQICKAYDMKADFGHVGTLDPLAEGILPLVFGRAKKLQAFLVSLPKTYIFEMKFGTETDTLDTAGEVIKSESVPSLADVDAIEAVLGSFVGEIKQTPPLYSALKYKGRPLYEYARKDLAHLVPFDELARDITIYAIDLVEISSPDTLKIKVRCSQGTYVRVLARDIALILNSCATVTSISRVACSGISIEAAVPLEALLSSSECFASSFIRPEDLDLNVPIWKSLDSKWTQRLRHGQRLRLPSELVENGWKTPLKGNIKQSKPMDVFLIDEQERMFGIGQLRSQEPGFFEIGLRKELRS